MGCSPYETSAKLACRRGGVSAERRYSSEIEVECRKHLSCLRFTNLQQKKYQLRLL
jgi:hypothetical protein